MPLSGIKSLHPLSLKSLVRRVFWGISAFAVLQLVNAAPLAAFMFTAAPESGQAPLAVVLDATTVAGGLPEIFTDTVWDFGDGVTESGDFEMGGYNPKTTVTHLYAIPGIYYPTYEFTDQNGVRLLIFSVVEVLPAAESQLLVAFSANASPTKGIAPLEVSFSAFGTAGVPPFTYSFDFGDGSAPVSGISQNVLHTYADAGSYDATIEIYDSRGISRQVVIRISVVTETQVNELINELATDQISGIADLEELDVVMTPITDRFESLLDYVDDLESDAPVRIDAVNTALEVADSLFEQQLEAMQPLVNPAVSVEDISNVMDNTAPIAQAMLDSGLPMTQDMLNNCVAISNLAFQAVLDDILEPGGIDATEIQAMLDDPESARAFLSESSHSNILDELLSATAVDIGVVRELDREQVSQVLAARGLPDSATDAVTHALPEVMNAAIGLLQEDGGESRTVLDLLDAQLSSTSTVDSLSSVITTRFANNAMATHAVTGVSIAPDYLPEGVHVLSDGTVLSIKDNLAVRLAPASADPVAVAAEVSGFGLIPEFRPDGRLIVSNANDAVQHLVNMGWLMENINSFLAGAVSFSVSGTDPASEAYAFLITYEDGSSQSAAPMIMAKDPLLEMLETYFPGLYSLNLQTGVLDMRAAGTTRYKADWAFENLSALDYAVIQAAGGFVVGDTAFEVGDYNGDGVVDLWYYSPDPMGRQILYGLAD